ncbi:SurA N-terminal domain-containing protein [Candidatus Endowatersipora endosymbiont of Watersipora subatra]|uniref:SurA N-terminal domain-containing protein n=1 Tax=Candidatus Endowatersipora endosymbiont of Watersipora subatra TaxID=3077946 RepID=UPI00312C9A8D
MNLADLKFTIQIQGVMLIATLLTIVGDSLFSPFAKASSQIAIIVNNQIITNNDIRHRTAFFRLRGEQGNIKKKVLQELIDEVLKMQEANRIGTVAHKKEVEIAYLGFAKSNKISLSRLNQIMNESGITIIEFKKYIRTQISWQRAVSTKMINRSRIEKRSQSWLSPIEESVKNTTEYTFQQVVFTIPITQRSLILNHRQTESKKFRKKFKGCDSSLALAQEFNDVAVIDRGRKLRDELPKRWRDLLKTTPVGGISNPQFTDRGIEMLAVCKIRTVFSDNAIDFFDDRYSKESIKKIEKDYFDLIKTRSIIKYR